MSAGYKNIMNGNVVYATPPGCAVLADSTAIESILLESNAVQSDNSSFDVTAQYSESNATQTETLSVGVESYVDSVAAQTQSRSSLVTRWVSTTSTGGGTAPTNTANAQGQNNGSVATCKAGGIISGSSVLTCNIVAPFGEIPAGSTRVLSAYYAFNQGISDSCGGIVSYRQVGQGTNTSIGLPTSGNFLTTPTTVTLTNIDPNFNIIITYTHTAGVPATGGSVVVDATGIETSGVL